jgi:hypothetical protein
MSLTQKKLTVTIIYCPPVGLLSVGIRAKNPADIISIYIYIPVRIYIVISRCVVVTSSCEPSDIIVKCIVDYAMKAADTSKLA